MTDPCHPPTPSPYAQSPGTVAQAYVDGRTAGTADVPLSDGNPHATGSHEHGAWRRGFALDRHEA